MDEIDQLLGDSPNPESTGSSDAGDIIESAIEKSESKPKP